MSNTENTENTSNLNNLNTSQPISVPAVVIQEKVKKPRKPLSEESKKKRADALVIARQAKLKKANETPKPIKLKKEIDLKPVVEPLLNQILESRKAQKPPKIKNEVTTKKPKTDEEKIMKKVNKKLQVEAIVQEKLTEFNDMLKFEKQQKQNSKSFSVKNLF